MIRVFVCDDSDWFCELVAAWLEPHADLELAGHSHERGPALAALAAAGPHVVLLDTMTYGLEPLHVADVRAASPGTAVLICSGYPAAHVTALLGDADGYVSKDDARDTLIPAIRGLAGRG